MHFLDTGCFVRAELTQQPSEQRPPVCTAASSPPLSQAEPPGSHPAPHHTHTHQAHPWLSIGEALQEEAAHSQSLRKRFREKPELPHSGQTQDFLYFGACVITAWYQPYTTHTWRVKKREMKGSSLMSPGTAALCTYRSPPNLSGDQSVVTPELQEKGSGPAGSTCLDLCSMTAPVCSSEILPKFYTDGYILGAFSVQEAESKSSQAEHQPAWPAPVDTDTVAGAAPSSDRPPWCSVS